MPLQSLTEPSSWSIGELQAALSPQPAGKKLELPKFQRTIVWSASQRQELIKSLRLGHPVGALLLFESPTSAGQNRYLLVDGLQRVTAIRDYLSNPLSYLAEGGVGDELVEKLVSTLGADLSLVDRDEEVRHAAQVWMRQTRDLKAASGFVPQKLIQTVMDELHVHAEPEVVVTLGDALAPIFDDIQEEVEVSQIQIAVLLFRGDQSDLPDIFEKLNSAGTSLSKYEIYAATWVDQDTKIEDPSIRDAIDAKYQDLLDRGYEIAGLDEPGHSLFEYLFGLGKILGARYPLLFGSATDSAAPEAIAFTLMTVAHQVEVPDMRILPSKLRTSADQPIDPGPFQSALFAAIDFVQDLLRPCIGLKLNETRGGPSVVHTQFQIASLICRVMAATHEPFTWEPRQDPGEELAILKRTLRRHYFNDLIRAAWRSAGDDRVFRRTWTREEDGSTSASSFYLYEPTKEEISQALDIWFSDQLHRNQKARSSVRAIDKLFLRFVYSDVVTVFDSADKSFELEHLFPVSRLVQLVKDEPEGWPISAISNLALFETKLNREKSGKTINEYLDGIADEATQTSKTGEIKRYLLCNVEDVAIPKDEASEDVLTREEYESFLSKRFEAMRRLVLKTLGYEVGAAEVIGNAGLVT